MPPETRVEWAGRCEYEQCVDVGVMHVTTAEVPARIGRKPAGLVVVPCIYGS
jgi:hypothetical protein